MLMKIELKWKLHFQVLLIVLSFGTLVGHLLFGDSQSSHSNTISNGNSQQEIRIRTNDLQQIDNNYEDLLWGD